MPRPHEGAERTLGVFPEDCGPHFGYFQSDNVQQALVPVSARWQAPFEVTHRSGSAAVYGTVKVMERNRDHGLGPFVIGRELRRERFVDSLCCRFAGFRYKWAAHRRLAALCPGQPSWSPPPVGLAAMSDYASACPFVFDP